MSDALAVVSVAAALGVVVTTVVEVRRRGPDKSVGDAWGDPSGLRTTFIVILVVSVLLATVAHR